jgi:catechol 2,3-dioxygenase-like lactoylglutathione lyase family enzyme
MEIPFIEQLLTRYESGRITRRALIGALAGATLANKALGSEPPPLQGVSINHVTLKVSDAARSGEFYRKLLSLPILRQKASATLLGVGTSFIALDSTPTGDQKGIDHFSFGVREFNLDRATALLKEKGVQPELVQDVELYFRDPDGIRLQVSSPEYAGHP